MRMRARKEMEDRILLFIFSPETNLQEMNRNYKNNFPENFDVNDVGS